MFLSFPFVIYPFLSTNRKRRNTGIKWYLFTSINRTKNRKSLISQTFPLSKFPLSNSLPSSKHFLPHSGIFNEQGKVFFFSLSPLYLDTIIRGKNKLDLWTNEFKYSFSPLYIAGIRRDEDKAYLQNKIRQRFFIFILKKKNIYVNVRDTSELGYL